MKLSLMFLLIGILQVSASVHAQNGKLNVQVENMQLSDLLWQLQEESGVVFIYQTDDLVDVKNISLETTDASITEILDEILEDTDLDYTLDNKVVIIKKKDVVPEIEKPVQEQKKVKIKGVVYTDKGEPAAFCNVVDLKNNVGTVTDENGVYEIEVSGMGAVITVSYIGYKRQDIFITEKTEYNIILVSEDFNIDEVVVTGYQTLSRERAAGSFGKINNEDLQKRSNFNVLESIEGQVAGMLTDANGDITIRGRSTINAEREPLIVVDGFPIERSIESINPNDIENITVLKDASAASIWGVRAANGVIVITTKRAKSGKKKLSVDFSSSVSVSAANDLHDLPFAPTSSFIEYEKFRADNGLVIDGTLIKSAHTQFIDAYRADPSKYDELYNTLTKNDAYKEFEDLFMRPQVKQQYSLAVSGSGEKSSHRASISYDNVGSQFKNNNTERLVADMFNSFNLTKKLKVDFGLNYAMNNSWNNGMSFYDLESLPRYQRILDDNGEYVIQPRGYAQFEKDRLIAAGAPYNWDYNLMQEFENKNNSFRDNSVSAIAKINYAITSKLSAQLGYQYESRNIKRTSIANENTYHVRNLVNNSTALQNDGEYKNGVPKGAIYSETNQKRFSQTFRGLLNYSGTIVNEKHYLAAVAGMEVREVKNESSSLQKYGYDAQSLQYASVNYADRYRTIDGGSQFLSDGTKFDHKLDRFVSYFGNLGYTYNEKYSINTSARLDKTNLFGKSDKYKHVWLWSVGGSWHAHKEDFFNLPFHTFTLRATYGLNGNVDTNTSPLMTAEITTSMNTHHQLAYIKNPANPLLRWEKTAIANFGLDFSLFKGRLSSSVEYYNKYSSDLLGNAALNATYGFSRAYINYASMKNQGFDVRISGLVIDKAFRWNLTLNYSTNKNEVRKVEVPLNTVNSYLQVAPRKGKPIDYLYSYRWAGLSNEGAPQVYDQDGNIVNHQVELVDPKALRYEGVTTPKHYGSFISDMNYKSWSLSMKFTYKFGHKFRVPSIKYANISDQAAYIHEDWDKRWQKAGDENSTHIPAAATIPGLKRYDEYHTKSSINVQSAASIRFNELLLSYRLPKKMLKFGANADVTLGLQMKNLALINFNDADLDPEYHSTGYGINFRPRPEYSFVLRASF